MSTFTISTGNGAGQQTNTPYPHRADIATAADLEAAAKLDHAAAEVQAARRSCKVRTPRRLRSFA